MNGGRPIGPSASSSAAVEGGAQSNRRSDARKGWQEPLALANTRSICASTPVARLASDCSWQAAGRVGAKAETKEPGQSAAMRPLAKTNEPGGREDAGQGRSRHASPFTVNARAQVGRPGDPATRRPGDPATRRP